MLLSSKSEKYVTPAHVETMGKKAHEFPDSVVDAFLQETRAVPPATYAAMPDPRDITDPPLDLDASKKLVSEALKNYDLPLGTRVEEILDKRLRAQQEAPDRKGAMQCYVPIGDKTYPQVQGTIQYDYLNGAIDDAIMLGHEAGHGIADDNIRRSARLGAGGTCDDGDQLEHMQETQAYFIQQIVYDYLMKHPDEKIANAATQHFTATMTRNIYNLSVADLARQAKDALGEGTAFNAREAFEARLGPGWEKDEWARGVFDVVTAAQKAKTDQTMPAADRLAAEQKLDVEADYVHGRPASLLSALVLYQKTRENPATKQAVLEAVMAGKGPRNIISALSQAGIVDDAALERQAQAAIDSSTAYIRARQPAPPAAANQPRAPAPVQT